MVRFSYYKTANCTASCSVVRCGAVRCTITCGVIRLYHFTDNFSAIFMICAVYATW